MYSIGYCTIIIIILLHIENGILKDIRLRVINGHSADYAHPADVSLKTLDPIKGTELKHFCGGVVMNGHWVLTAAHCFPKGELPRPLILDIQKRSGYHAAQLVRYPCRNSSDDLVLLRIREKIKGVEAKLPFPGYEPEGDCEVCGLGTIERKNIVFPKTLQCASVPILDKETCQKALGAYKNLSEGTICAGGGTSDACKGDSGSALHCRKGSELPILAGIVAYGLSCAVEGVPGVYTDVGKYLDWIKKTIDGTWTTDSCSIHVL